MKSISLKVDDSIFTEVENVLSDLKIPRNRYINEAIAYYTKIQKRKLLEKQIQKEALLTMKESMAVLKEFEAFEFED